VKLMLRSGWSKLKENKLAAFVTLEEQTDDGIRTSNYALSVKNMLEDMLERNSMKEEDIEPMFDIIMEYSDVRGKHAILKMDYQKHPGCPQFIVDWTMPIYLALKSDARKKKKEWDEFKEQKQKNIDVKCP